MLASEKPFESVMLLSLTGVRCIVTNQWHCTLQENATKFEQIMQGIAVSSIQLLTDVCIRLYKNFFYLHHCIFVDRFTA
jgi:hypothetical protein